MMRDDTADEELRHCLLRVVATIGMQLVQGAQIGQMLQTLEDETAALQPLIQAHRRAHAEAWLERQARKLKPREPRRTQGWIRRNGRALVESMEAQR